MPTNSVVDLTHLYLRFRTEYKKRVDLFGLFNRNKSSSINKDLNELNERTDKIDNTIIEMKSSVLPPFWVDLHVEAQEELTRAKELISILQKTQQKRLMCVLKDNTMKSSEIEVDKLTYSICESFKRIENLAQSISNSSAESTENFPCGTSSINYKILKKNTEISIANELNPLSQQFKLIQKNYMAELQNNYKCLDRIQTNYEDPELRGPKFTENSYSSFQENNQSKELIFTDLNNSNIEVSYVKYNNDDLLCFYKGNYKNNKKYCRA